MASEPDKSFLDLAEADIVGWATAPDARLAIPPQYLDAVVANLRGLRHHAQIMQAALAAEPNRAAPPGPFEP